jgi:hypothetical protein
VTPSSATAGTVTSQFPAPGAQVAPGTAIDIFVAVPAAPAWSFAPLQWLGAGLLLGLGVAAAASFTRKLVNRFANPPVLAPRSDAGFQTSDPDDERLADFVVTLDAYPDRGEQALEETDGFVTGNWTGKQVMT